MNTIWIATHSLSPDDTALALGHTAEDAAALLSAQFPRCSEFVVGRAEVGQVYSSVDDSLTHRSIVRRQQGGVLLFTALADGVEAWR